MADIVVDKLRKTPAFVLLLIAGLIILSSAAVATLSVGAATTTMSLQAETLATAEVEVDQDSLAVKKADADEDPTGQTAEDAVEATDDFPTVYTDIDKGDWVYQFAVQETGARSWTGGTYKIELYGNDELKDTLYAKNSSGTSVEGVTARFSLGSDTDIPGNMLIVVTKE